MNDNLFIGAYWSSREENRRECAERVLRFLNSIKMHPDLTHWFWKLKSRKEAAVPLELSIAGIEEGLKTNNRDSNGTAIRELGFSMGAWNGNDAKPASLGITCGASSNFVKNSVVLDLPPQPPPTEAQSFEVLRVLLEKTIIAWDPDDAVVTSTDFLDRRGGGMPWIVGGWISYHRGGNIEIEI